MIGGRLSGLRTKAFVGRRRPPRLRRNRACRCWRRTPRARHQAGSRSLALERAAQQTLEAAVGQRRPFGQASGQDHRLLLEPGGGDDPVHQAETQRLGGVDRLRQQGDLHRSAQADQARQVPRAGEVAARADAGVGEVEARVLGGDREVGGERKAHAAAGDRALQAGDHRRIERLRGSAPRDGANRSAAPRRRRRRHASPQCRRRRRSCGRRPRGRRRERRRPRRGAGRRRGRPGPSARRGR